MLRDDALEFFEDSIEGLGIGLEDIFRSLRKELCAGGEAQAFISELDDLRFKDFKAQENADKQSSKRFASSSEAFAIRDRRRP